MELRDDSGTKQLIHNRFYIAPAAQRLEFDLKVPEVNDFAADGTNHATLVVELVVGTQTYQLGVPLLLQQTTQNFVPVSFTLPAGVVGKVASSLTFRLVSPNGNNAPSLGRDRVWLDNIRLTPTGQALQSEVSVRQTETAEVTTGVDFSQLVDAANSLWIGLDKLPYGSAWGQAGTVLVSTELPVNSEPPNESLNHEGNTGFIQSSLNNQLILADHEVSSIIDRWANHITLSGGGASAGMDSQTILLSTIMRRRPPTAIPFKPNKIPGWSLERAR